MATGIYSAIYKIPVKSTVAMTGEISIHGDVKSIGGVFAKVKAAKQAGAELAIVPRDNVQSILKEIDGITIQPVDHLDDVFALALHIEAKDVKNTIRLDKKESV